MSIIGSLVNTVGQGVSSLFGYKGQKDANKANIAIAEAARGHDYQMWKRQNEYNTPAMQMQRLKEAGLNPNLIYGSGQAQTGNADAPKAAPVPHVSNEMATIASQSLIPMLAQYQDWQVKKAQIENINQDTTNKEMTNQILGYTLPYQSDLARYNAETKKWQSYQEVNKHQILADQMNISRNTLEDKILQSRYNKDLLRSRLGESEQRIDYLRKSTRQKELQIQLDEQLKPYGMSTADELWQRKLVPLIEDLLSPQKWIRNKFKK